MLTISSKDKAGLSEPEGDCALPVTPLESLASCPGGGALGSGVWGAPAKMPEIPSFALES